VTTTLGKKGQIVIPQAIRQRAKLKPGDDFSVSRDTYGRIVLEKLVRPAARAPRLVLRKGQPPKFITPKNARVLSREEIQQLETEMLK